ncbi:cellulose binding domain-containing protein [Micromonospora sp. M12]
MLQETIEQWTNVFGLSQTPTSTDTPQANWNRRRYADSSGTVQVEAYSVQGAGHSLPSSGMAASAVAFFGLTDPTTPPRPRRPRPRRRRPPAAGFRRLPVSVDINAWNTGLTENITIANTGTSAVNGWSLVFTLPSGQTITSGWNATYSPSSGQVTARNVAYNGASPPTAR